MICSIPLRFQVNHSIIEGQGLATIANSLAAIKWAIFDKKLLTMKELVKHLRNSSRAEDVRRMHLKAPNYLKDDIIARLKFDLG